MMLLQMQLSQITQAVKTCHSTHDKRHGSPVASLNTKPVILLHSLLQSPQASLMCGGHSNSQPHSLLLYRHTVNREAHSRTS